jgi:hypothetical protein
VPRREGACEGAAEVGDVARAGREARPDSEAESSSVLLRASLSLRRSRLRADDLERLCVLLKQGRG